MNYWFLLIPLLTAFTGWIVVRLLFQLLVKRLPGYQQQLAEKAGELAAAEFSSFSLDGRISDPQNFENLKPLIETHVDDFLRNKLKEQMPMISMFIGDKTINTLKGIFIVEVESLFPQVMQQFAGNLKSKIDIRQMVASRIAAIPAGQIEHLLYQHMKRERQMAAMFGLIAGLVIGLIQLVLLLIIS